MLLGNRGKGRPKTHSRLIMVKADRKAQDVYD